MKIAYTSYSRQAIDKKDIKAVTNSLKANIITRGNFVKSFEEEISAKFNSKYTISVNSASSALLLSCMALNLTKGDILWTSSITYAASANCGLICGAQVDLIDIDIKSFNISLSAFKDKLIESKKNNKLPKVVVIVHLAGNPLNLFEIYKLGKKYKFKIIADCSHAMGSSFNGDLIGSSKYIDINVFSFHPVKSITTGEGGAILTNRENIYKRIKILKSNGINKDAKSKIYPFDLFYDQVSVGYNFNMSDINASLGLSQLEKIDDFIKKRNDLALIYKKHLKNLPIDFQNIDIKSYSSYHLFIILLHKNNERKNRNNLFNFLKKNLITTNLHYIPLYNHSIFKQNNFNRKNFINSENYFNNALSIPLHQKLHKKDIVYISDKIKYFFNE